METEEQRIAREKAEDETAAKEFMKGSTGPVYRAEDNVPSTPEEAQAARNKAAYEAKEAAAAEARAVRQAQVQSAGEYMNNVDNARVQKVMTNSKWVPDFITQYAVNRIRERQAGRSDDAKVQAATDISASNRAYADQQVANEERDKNLPELAKRLIKGASPPGSVSPAAFRQPTSFTREKR